jgi:hypothetical protein
MESSLVFVDVVMPLLDEIFSYDVQKPTQKERKEKI